ncbi:MAG: hypothetical protein Q9188_007134, partial [Gyalolechia gomerana]
MSSTQPVDDSYFNDLSRQPSLPTTTTPPTNGDLLPNEGHDLPKPKRVACAICRKRKLKCDGGRPKCGTCARLGHNCAYDEVRRKSGPKRGYVKELEARLAQVETQLKTKTKQKNPPTSVELILPQDQQVHTPSTDHATTNSSGDGDKTIYPMGISGPATDLFGNVAVQNDNSTAMSMLPDLNNSANPLDDDMTWEMIGLGLEEPLPTQEAIDELHDIFFKSIHPSIPIIHQYRYRAAMGLSPHMRPPVCLCYAVWCLASNLSGRYRSHQDIFYRRARRYAELDEMKGLGESFVTIAHAQCWVLIATYEFQMMYFPRAWASAGRAVRLVLMMGLNRLDGTGLNVKQVLAPPRDWTEREERRRTFWMTYCCDRYASMGTGWPVSMDERDIMTNLPANEDNFDRSIQEDTASLSASTTPEGAAKMSPFGGVIYMAHVFGKNLNHLHRPGTDDKDDDLQGEFWRRHRQLDNTLLKTSLSLPPHLRLPTGIRNPNCVFLNMCIHTSTICLHQAALSKAEMKKLPPSISEQSSTRCLLAATEVANIVRLISHLDCQGMNPFIAFCLYVAARVFIHVLKKNPNETEIRSSLELFLAALQQFKTTNPLAESFLIQLGLDLRGTGMNYLLQNNPHSSTIMAKLELINKHESHVTCSPIVDVRDANNHKHPFQAVPRLPKKGSGIPHAVADGQKPSSPRSTQYSMQSFELPSRESPRPQAGVLGDLDGSMPDFLQKVSNSEPFGGAFPGSATGLINLDNSYDTDMSGGQNSSRPSPENSSTNTSYSPHSQHTEDISSTMPKASAYQPADPLAGTPKFFNFTNGDGNFVSAMPSQPHQTNGDFDLSSSNWGLDPAAASPSNFTTGLTPAADGEWSQILDNMNWDSTMLDANTTPWSTSPG